MAKIDHDKLVELIAEPNAKLSTIYEGLGFNNSSAFYYQLKKDPLAKELFESRPGARAHAGGPKIGAKRPRQSGTKKGATRRSSKKASTPPRKGNATTGHRELLRKLEHEFDHIEIYGATSEHFDDLRAEVVAAVI